VVLSLLLIAVGCSDDDGGTTGPPSGDTDPPQIANVLAINQFQVEAIYNEDVDKASAEHTANYTIVEQASTPVATTLEDGRDGDDMHLVSAGDTLMVATAALVSSKKVLLTLYDFMVTVPYKMYVNDVEDLNGNKITAADTSSFSGSIASDNTPPEVVSVTPPNSSSNVGVGESMVVQFSEPMNYMDVLAAFTFQVAGNNTQVSASGFGVNTFLFTPVLPLPLGTSCMARISTVATDPTGNAMTAPFSWSYSTTANADAMRPTLVSTTPANGATNVSTNVTLRLTFSEAIDPTTVETEGGPGIMVNPDIGDGVVEWSADRKTLTFDPNDPIASNTMHALTIPEGAVRDLAGNPLLGSTTIQFTTAASFPTGAMTGTITGDQQPGSPASDPTGTVVIATTNSPFSDVSDDVFINGSAVAGVGGIYSIQRLPDAWYFPFAIMDSNDDGFLDPERGDALGALGVDIEQQILDIDSVQISGGNPAPNVDFPIFDPVAIAGAVTYGGTMYPLPPPPDIYYFVGAWDTTGLDTTGGLPDPDFGTMGDSFLLNPHYSLNMLSDSGLDPGTYYVGAFADLDGDTQYDPDSEPANFYGTGGQWLPVTVLDGMDRLDIDIVLEDPNGSPFASSAWRKPDGVVSKERELLRLLGKHAVRVSKEVNR
jgi:hypothetical protein